MGSEAIEKAKEFEHFCDYWCIRHAFVISRYSFNTISQKQFDKPYIQLRSKHLVQFTRQYLLTPVQAKIKNQFFVRSVIFDPVGEILRTNLQMGKIMPFMIQLRSSKIRKSAGKRNPR